jgi:hypothetical protein
MFTEKIFVLFQSDRNFYGKRKGSASGSVLVTNGSMRIREAQKPTDPEHWL